MGSTSTDGFETATTAYHFDFPRDHGSHPQYRLEWWYVTGQLHAKDGHSYGYELTFFREGLAPGDPPPLATQSKWRGNQVYPAHFALTDITNQHFYAAGRFEREALNQANASQAGLAVHVGSWTMRMDDGGRIHLAATTPDFGLQLSLSALKPIVIEGAKGVNMKGSCASCGSHYYSMTRLATSGAVSVGTLQQKVEGLSWLDHEFGTHQIEPQIVGWDWFALILDDGRELMIYRLRRKDGSIIPQSMGTFIAKDGSVRYLNRDDVQIVVKSTWRSSKTQTVYPSLWDIDVPSADLHLQVTPLLADQELAVGLGNPIYWEGASAVQDHNGRHVGNAYVELTGYSAPVGPL